jgi:hypothetical protein
MGEQAKEDFRDVFDYNPLKIPSYLYDLFHMIYENKFSDS